MRSIRGGQFAPPVTYPEANSSAESRGAVAQEIPTSVTIGPHTFQVRLHPNGGVNADRDRGGCDPDYLVIDLDTSLPPSTLRETLVHELCHAAMAQIGHGLDEETEERLITGLSPLLYGSIRDNPGLVGFLAGGNR